MPTRAALLLVSNYSDNTGYAWSNIYKLFNSIARICVKNNVDICSSFTQINNGIQIFDDNLVNSTLVFDPYNITLKSLRLLRIFIKENNIRYVYLTDMNTWHWLYALLKIWGVRKVLIHCRISVPEPFAPAPEKGLRKYLKSIINRTPFISADRVYAISDFVGYRIILKHCYPENRVTRIHNGIDTEKYACSAQMSVNENVLIFCGSRANKHKGIPTLIKAAKVLKYDYKINNFHIMYAGSGPDLDNFKQLANKLCVEDKFEFLGQLASTHDHACRSDIIVVPSEWGEGFGSTVVEGMAAGKVVVATRVGGIPEIVSRPDLGLLIEPGDDELLAKTLKTLINDPVSRNSYGINAKKWASKYFDESVYHSAVTERIMKDIGAAPNGKNS